MTPGETPIRIGRAAACIGMSPSFLRKSTCPCHRKLGNGPKGKPVIVYYESEVRAWWAERDLNPALRRAG